jgi:hypothetical protein
LKPDALACWVSKTKKYHMLTRKKKTHNYTASIQIASVCTHLASLYIGGFSLLHCAFQKQEVAHPLLPAFTK